MCSLKLHSTIWEYRGECCAALATAAVHHHLVRQGLRMQTGLVVETGEAREVHHFCVLAGYGAEAINPYLAFRAVLLAISEFQPRERFLKDRFLCLFRRIFENPHMLRAEIPRKAKWMSERLFSRSLDSAPIN